MEIDEAGARNNNSFLTTPTPDKNEDIIKKHEWNISGKFN